jgi:hypothetical protein
LFRPAQVVPLRFNVRLQSRVAFRLGVRSAITVYPSPSLDDLRIVADTADLRDIAELIEMQRLHAMLSRNLDVEWCDG